MQKRAQQHPWRLNRLLVALALASLTLACKGSDDKPSTPPDETSAGAGGDSQQPGSGPGGAEAGGTGNAQGGAAPVGEGGEINLPVGGAAPTEPGSWDESFWDDAVWQ